MQAGSCDKYGMYMLYCTVNESNTIEYSYMLNFAIAPKS